jgi:hypothetical protein
MGRYARHLSTFDNVKSWYERTKPVVSKTHTKEDDIRPLGDRRHKWERIEKINNNCYAILGPYGFDGISYYGERFVKNRVTGVELKRVAPILWERNPKTGEEFVTVHNARHGYATGLYCFLRADLPGRLDLPALRDGRQWITNGQDKFYLPHNKYIPKPLRAGPYRLKGKELAEASKPSAERKLVFKRVANEFVLVSDPYALTVKAKTTVDRETKNAFCTEIQDFKRFVATTAPLLVGTSKQDIRTAVADLLSAAVAAKPQASGRWWERYPEKQMRLALTDPHSPMRLALVYAFIEYNKECDWDVSRDRQSAPDLVRARLNAFVNLAFRFTKPNE